jgi:hypothetical protein
MALDEKLVDKRVIRRHLERGRIDAVAYRGMLESLRDASDNVQREAAREAAPHMPAGANEQS